MLSFEPNKIKTFLENYIEILKAKKRNEGEVWTQPSGRKVTKKGGKIVPVSGPEKSKKEEDEEGKEKKPEIPSEEEIHKQYDKALKDGMSPDVDFEKFKHSVEHYHEHKEHIDNHYKKVAEKDLSKHKNPKLAQAVLENKTPKALKGKSEKPVNKQVTKMLYENNKPLEKHEKKKNELDKSTRFDEYLAGDKKILTGRKELSQLPENDYLSKDLEPKLLPHQKDAVNLALDKFNEGEKGFLLADGTGTGKTVQALALADSYLRTKDSTKPIIIITESDNILNTAWMNDAKMLGIEINNAKENGFIPGKINITTYSQAKKVKELEGKGLLIFDEAHNMKNPKGNATKHLREAIKNSDHVFNATATPIDKLKQIDYLCYSLGLDPVLVKKELKGKAPKRKRKKGKRTEEEKEQDKEYSAFQTALNLTSFFEDVTRKGLMVKREVPMANLDIDINDTKFSPENEAKIQKAMEEVKATGNKKLFTQVRRLIEEFKVEQLIDDVVKDIAENGQSIIFADRVSDSKILGFDSPGTLPLIEKKLREKGIAFESIYGGTQTAKQKREVKAKVDRFQSGKSKVIIGNPPSMGTGISLDDTTGNAPRTLRMLTPPYSAMTTIQVLGRHNRLKTKGRAKAVFYKHDNLIDSWNIGILKNKIQTLGAAVGGDYAEMDLEKKGIPTKGISKEPPPININNFKPKQQTNEEIGKSYMVVDLNIFNKFFQILKARTVKYFKRIPNPSGGKTKWRYFYTQADWDKHTEKHHKNNPLHPDNTQPKFSLEQEEKTHTEKVNQSEHQQRNLFGNAKKEKFVDKNFKPEIKTPETSIPGEYITEIKNKLLSEGLDERASTFVNEAMKAENLNEIKEIAQKYISSKENKNIAEHEVNDALSNGKEIISNNGNRYYVGIEETPWIKNSIPIYNLYEIKKGSSKSNKLVSMQINNHFHNYLSQYLKSKNDYIKGLSNPIQKKEKTEKPKEEKPSYKKQYELETNILNGVPIDESEFKKYPELIKKWGNKNIKFISKEKQIEKLEPKKVINTKYLPNDNQWEGIQKGNSDTLTRFANKLWSENNNPSALANSINKGRLDQDSLNDAKQEAMILIWQKHQSGEFKEATPQNLVSYCNKVLHHKINEVSKLQNKAVFGSEFLDKVEVEHGINPESEFIKKEDLKEHIKNIQEKINTLKEAAIATQKNQWSTSERNHKVWDEYLGNYKSGKPNYKGIAEKYSLNENQVKQIIKNIKNKLKKSLNSSGSVVESKQEKMEPPKKEKIKKTTKSKIKSIFAVWLEKE